MMMMMIIIIINYYYTVLARRSQSAKNWRSQALVQDFCKLFPSYPTNSVKAPNPR